MLELSEATRYLLWCAPADASEAACGSALLAETAHSNSGESEDEEEEQPEATDEAEAKRRRVAA